MQDEINPLKMGKGVCGCLPTTFHVPFWMNIYKMSKMFHGEVTSIAWTD